jgi:hypothetical protein
MSEHEQLYRQASRELAEQRKRQELHEFRLLLTRQIHISHPL